jgi:hypothetical protein
MGVPVSGEVSLGDIGSIYIKMQPTNVSLRECTLVTAVGGYYDPQWFGTPYEISSFRGWVGYGYNYNFSAGIIHDFGLNALYPTSTSVIADCAFTSRTGTFVTGTGNGTPTTIDQYTATSPGYMTIPGDSAQKSIRLNDSMKFGGTSNYTIITWFRVSAFSSSFPGIVAAEGRVGSTPIGYAMYLRSTPDFSIIHTRYNASSGSSGNNILTWGSCSIPAFAYNTWYMSAVRFDGSVMSLRLYAGGSGYNASVSYPNPLSTSASWSAFLGLRYNNWFNGRIGYYAVYGSTLTEGMLDTVFTNTRGRYGV